MITSITNLLFELILQLQKNPSHIRALANTLDQPYPTVREHLLRLEDLHAVNTTIQGKNKVYSLKTTLPARAVRLQAELYKLTKTLQKYPTLRIILSDLQEHTNKPIILFGSYAKHTATQTSDIDIYIPTTDQQLKKRLEQTHHQLSVKTGAFNQQHPLIQEIIKDHVVIQGIEAFYELQFPQEARSRKHSPDTRTKQ